MKLFKETTVDWAVPTKNHTYLLSDNKEWLYGIVRGNDLEVLKNRVKFSPRDVNFSNALLIELE
jgi:hypothetical protein